LPGLLAFPYPNDEGEMLEFERARRVPFMLPQLSFLNQGRNPQDEDRPEEMMKRRRRNPFLRPMELPEDRDGDDDDYEYERKRRGVYLYPMMDNWWDKRGEMSKRGTPFYFPFSYFKFFSRLNHRG